MSEASDGSLAEALESAIESMRRAFGSDWLLVLPGADEEGGAGTEHSQDCTPHDPLEVHTFIELCICLRGCFHLGAGDTGHEMKAGRMCLLLPGTAHVEIPGRDYSAVWISVSHGRASAHLSGRQYPSSFAVKDLFIFKPSIECLYGINEIISETTGRNAFYIDMIKAGVVKLLAICSRELGTSICSGDWKESITSEVRLYIKKNLGYHLRLSDIAQTMCISSNHLNMIFKAQTGKTIMQFHEECRLNAARELISQTRTSINRIAASLGYYDQYHFSKAFKKRSAFRLRHTGASKRKTARIFSEIRINAPAPGGMSSQQLNPFIY
jgi:AraC-like DNA-binding protein